MQVLRANMDRTHACVRVCVCMRKILLNKIELKGIKSNSRKTMQCCNRISLNKSIDLQANNIHMAFTQIMDGVAH